MDGGEWLQPVLPRHYSQGGIPIAAPQVWVKSPFATEEDIQSGILESMRQASDDELPAGFQAPWLQCGTQFRGQFAHDNDGFKEGDPVEICDCGVEKFKGQVGVLGLFDKELALWSVNVADVGTVRCDVFQLRNLAANQAEIEAAPRLRQASDDELPAGFQAPWLQWGTQFRGQFAHDNDGFKEGDPVEICDCGVEKFKGQVGGPAI